MLYNCRVRVYPAVDVPGEWIGENITFDVMSQGKSPDHALQMANEATLLTLQHDLDNGQDPWLRSKSDADIEALTSGTCAIYHDVVYNVVKGSKS